VRTTLEQVRALPKTDDPKETARRDKIFAERDEEEALIKPGLTMYLIKNTSTKELRYKTATTYRVALAALGWSEINCRITPIEVGKEKKPMPEEIKEILKAKNEEKKVERSEGKPEKKEKGPTLKSEMEEVFRQFPAEAKEDMLPRLFQILKNRNPEKEDAKHMKRAVLCYHFYKPKEQK